MRKIKQSNEDEMVLEFLKMEIDSDRYSEKILSVLLELNLDRKLIENGDKQSSNENALRKIVLGRFRGYPDSEIFERFPQKIDWIWAAFDAEDISKIFYIEYSYWNELSNYTGSPLEAAKTILSGKTIYGVPNDRALSGAQKIRDGYTFPPLIFLTDKAEERYIVLEGHGRMTAYGLVPELFQNVSALLGYCDGDELNDLYGRMPERPE